MAKTANVDGDPVRGVKRLACIAVEHESRGQIGDRLPLEIKATKDGFMLKAEPFPESIAGPVTVVVYFDDAADEPEFQFIESEGVEAGSHFERSARFIQPGH